MVLVEPDVDAVWAGVEDRLQVLCELRDHVFVLDSHAHIPFTEWLPMGAETERTMQRKPPGAGFPQIPRESGGHLGARRAPLGDQLLNPGEQIGGNLVSGALRPDHDLQVPAELGPLHTGVAAGEVMFDGDLGPDVQLAVEEALDLAKGLATDGAAIVQVTHR
jgi:hypothetical protein